MTLFVEQLTQSLVAGTKTLTTETTPDHSHTRRAPLDVPTTIVGGWDGRPRIHDYEKYGLADTARLIASDTQPWEELVTEITGPWYLPWRRQQSERRISHPASTILQIHIPSLASGKQMSVTLIYVLLLQGPQIVVPRLVSYANVTHYQRGVPGSALREGETQRAATPEDLLSFDRFLKNAQAPNY